MKTDNTIFIVGAGAIGKALAVFLKQEGKPVILLRGSINDNAHYYEKIQIELNNDIIVTATVEVSTISNYSALNGIVVLTNKSYGNQHLSETLKNKINHSPIIILQNGLKVEQPFIDNGFPQIYRGVLFATSQPVSHNYFRFKPVAASPIGVVIGDNKRLAAAIAAINNNYFPFQIAENILPLIWTKAIVNCVFNTVCPLLETDNSIFIRNEQALHIAKNVITECVAVASAKGILLNIEHVTDRLLQISKSTQGQLISTYQDIKNNRRTEIETFNFAIVHIATGLNMEKRVTETKLLGELVKLKSELTITDLTLDTGQL